MNSYLLYQCSLLLAPPKTIAMIEGLVKSFLLQGGKNGGGKKFALISWKKIKMPRMEGGLQIRDLNIQNLVMGAKLLWNMVDSKPSWCIQVIKCKYYSGPRLRCLDNEQENKQVFPIYSLCRKVLAKFKEELHWIPGNSKMINIW